MKATQVGTILEGIKVAALPADAQRSLAQRMNAWVAQYGIKVEKEKPTPKVASSIKPIVQKEKPMPKVDIEAIVTRVVAEAMASIVTEPTPIRRTTTKPKPKPKVNTFIEHLADIHDRNTEAGRVCKVKFTKGEKKGQTHGDFSAEGWVFHRKWCNGKVAR